MGDAGLGSEAYGVTRIDFVGLSTGSRVELVAADLAAGDIGHGAVGLVVCGFADVLPLGSLVGGVSTQVWKISLLRAREGGSFPRVVLKKGNSQHLD